jgi:integrase
VAKRTLNDRIIKALKPAATGQRREVWDALVPGLGVRVTDTGAKSFVLVTRYPGSTNPARRTLGSYGELTLEQARTRARHWLDLVGRGIDPAAESERQRLAEQRKRAGTFASVAETFIKEKVSTERQGKDVERQLRSVFIPAWGSRPVAEIEAADVKAIIRAKKAQGKEVMAHHLLATVRRLFAWAIDQGDYGLEHSPCDHIKAKSLIGKLAVRQRTLTDDEIRAFWRACVRMGYPHGDAGRLLLMTACRHREVTRAPWSEFDLSKAEWIIGAERFKTDAPHVVPLTADMLTLLEAVPRFRSGSSVFSVKYGRAPTEIDDRVKARLDKRMLRTLQAFARARGEDPAKVRLAPWVIHDLRRSVRTHMAKLQIPDHICELVLGHGKKGLRRTYDQHTYQPEIRSALERWNARLRDIVKPPTTNVVRLKARVS